MIITYREISRIEFPVYKLPSSNWQLIDGLLFLDDKLVDDRNQPGKTLGIRRLQTPHGNLCNLKQCIDSHRGILKQTDKCFIDTFGKPFIYEKTKNCTLSYYKIRKVEQKDFASLVWVKDVKQPFPVPRPPSDGMSWAGILHLHGLPWMLYEYSDSQKKSTSRKV